jgi:hypothetical protein
MLMRSVTPTHGVMPRGDPEGSRRDADREQLAHGLRGETVAVPLQRAHDVHGDIEQRRDDPADQQDFSYRHRSQ